MKNKKNELVGIRWDEATDKFAQLYDNLDSAFGNTYSNTGERLAELADLRKGDIVIELGCGTGTTTQQIWNHVQPNGNVVGLDISKALIKVAKAKFNDNERIQFIQESGYNVETACSRLGLSNKVNAAISSWAYYYLYEDRKELHESIYNVLKTGGKWVFNITSSLSIIEHCGIQYNTFSVIFIDALNKLLKSRGFQPTEDLKFKEREQFLSAAWDLEALKQIGFKDVQAEAWPLPITPSQTYQFFIEGFCKHGARPTFASALLQFEQNEQIELLKKALDNCAQELDRTGEKPHILNVIATK